MSSEVFADSLQYPKMKQRAVSSRSFRTKISPSNSQSFTPGQTINIDLPGNMAGQYYNFSQMYLKVRLTTATHPAQLDRAGIVSAIKRVQISQAGSQIYDLNNYNVLYTALLDTESNAEWRGSVGNIMTGTQGNSLAGETKPVGAAGVASSRTYCIPLVLNPLSNTTPHRLIPAFSMSSIQFKITLDEQAVFLKYGTDVPTGVVFDEVELVSLMTELSPQAQSMIDSQTGGVYNILANSYMNSSANVQTGVSSASVNLGFSVSSLERILMVQRRNIDVADSTKFSIGNRIRNNLSEYSYQINSESYPQRPILVDDKSAEACAELLIAEHSLVDFRKGNNLNGGSVPSTNPTQLTSFVSGDPSVHPNNFSDNVPVGDNAGITGAAAATPSVGSTIGTAVYGCEFETGLSDGKSSHIYSGVSTLASNVQALLKYNTAADSAQLDFFAQFTILMSLDMGGSGVFSVSV